MKTKLYPALFIALLAATLYPCQNPTYAEISAEQYFDETGHSVSGEFWGKYQSVSDPTLLFGHPLTEAIQDQVSGRLVQYFRRARFELFPNDTEGKRVKLTLLGQEIYQPGSDPELSIPFNITACRYFAKTNKQICYSFLEFFEKYGGVEQFGYPISNIELHNNRIVQYFQYASFEWRPESPAGQRVVLSDLGTIYFEKTSQDPAQLQPILPPSKGDNIAKRILNLQVNAFIARNEAKNSRTLYVIVKDQNRQPVPGITVDFAIRLPDGSEKSFIMPLPTNQSGFAYMTFGVDLFPPNQLIEIVVRVNHQGLEKDARTAFWAW